MTALATYKYLRSLGSVRVTGTTCDGGCGWGMGGVRSVFLQVLRGPGVTSATRRARAAGLKELGRIFQECAKAALRAEGKTPKGEVRSRL